MPMLQGQVAFITGGASGIGRASAVRLAQEGAKIAIADLPAQEPAAAEVIAAIRASGSEAVFVPCDVSQADQVEHAINQTASTFGALHIVFANAGINGVFAPIEELHPTEWAHTLAINLTGTYLTVHHAIPHLRRAGGGSIVICSSVNGNRTFSYAGASAYSTSKAGQIAFMKMAAFELAQYNIRVNAVLPGAIRTNIEQNTHRRNTKSVEIKVVLPDRKAGLDNGWANPEEVADAVLFLASSLSRHVSGTEVYVDGGASLLR